MKPDTGVLVMTLPAVMTTKSFLWSPVTDDIVIWKLANYKTEKYWYE
jgi:hypothetical protein